MSWDQAKALREDWKLPAVQCEAVITSRCKTPWAWRTRLRGDLFIANHITAGWEYSGRFKMLVLSPNKHAVTVGISDSPRMKRQRAPYAHIVQIYSRKHCARDKCLNSVGMKNQYQMSYILHVFRSKIDDSKNSTPYYSYRTVLTFNWCTHQKPSWEFYGELRVLTILNKTVAREVLSYSYGAYSPQNISANTIQFAL